MTDPVAEMKARAVQLVVKMHGCDVESCPICVEQAGEVAAFAAKEVERATQPASAPKGPKKWICFHCEFETKNYAEAEAHFGDRGDPLICKLWQELSTEERLQEFQTMTQQLNMERDDNGELNMRAEKAEQAFLRATEAERLENAKAICMLCRHGCRLIETKSGSFK